MLLLLVQDLSSVLSGRGLSIKLTTCSRMVGTPPLPSLHLHPPHHPSSIMVQPCNSFAPPPSPELNPLAAW